MRTARRSGVPEIIQNVSPARLKQFYTDWYRPDLMAVIAVGDFDPAAVESMIVSHFERIPTPAAPRSRTIYTVPPHAETLYSLAADREATATTVNVFSVMPAGDQRTVGTYRQQMVERLFARLLSAQARRSRAWAGRAVHRGADQPRALRPLRGRHDRSRLWFPTAVRSVGSRRSSPRPNGSFATVSRQPSSIGKSSTVSATSTRRCSRKTRVHRVRSPTNWCATSFRTNRFPASSTNRRCRSGSCRRLRSPKSTPWRARGFPRAIASCRSPHPNAPASRCRRRPAWRRSSPPPARRRCRPTSIASTRNRCSPRCPRRARWCAPRRARPSA